MTIRILNVGLKFLKSNFEDTLPQNVGKDSGIVQQNPRNSVRIIASESVLKSSNTQKNTDK